MSNAQAATSAGDAGTTSLSTLTPAEERRWNRVRSGFFLRPRQWRRLASRMQDFHTYLKYEYDEIYALADGKYNNRGMSLTAFLQSAAEFKRHLEGHHGIEERFIFPILAKKMPAFRDNEQHRNSHKAIHDGLDALSTLLARFLSEPTKYSPVELRACLDGFRDVLTRHLDEEVNDLKAENMRKYWTLEEFERIPV